MALLLLCQKCNKTLTIHALYDRIDLDRTATCQGWTIDAKGWTCPDHDVDFPLAAAFDQTMEFAKSVRSKVHEKQTSPETLILELKEAKRRVDRLLSQMANTVPSTSACRHHNRSTFLNASIRCGSVPEIGGPRVRHRASQKSQT